MITMHVKSKWPLVITIACLIAGLSLFVFTHSNKVQLKDHQFIDIKIKEKILRVEVVRQPESLEKGLGGREEIGSDGMLFILPATTMPSFWMKDMKLDLDFVWLKNNQVVDVTENALFINPNDSTRQLQIYSPRSPVNMVLELPAGQIKKLEINNGDRLEFVIR
jgi:uncharacterized protein